MGKAELRQGHPQATHTASQSVTTRHQEDSNLYGSFLKSLSFSLCCLSQPTGSLPPALAPQKALSKTTVKYQLSVQ